MDLTLSQRYNSDLSKIIALTHVTCCSDGLMTVKAAHSSAGREIPLLPLWHWFKAPLSSAQHSHAGTLIQFIPDNGCEVGHTIYRHTTLESPVNLTRMTLESLNLTKETHAPLRC